MTTYTNPGTINATSGDDTIIFNTAPGDATITAVDALGGRDSLLVQFDYFQPASFDISDPASSGAFTTTARYGAYGPIIVVYNVESVELHGTSNDDTFHLQLGTAAESGQTLDGGAGQDLLQLDASKLSTAFNFVVSGTSISSNWGTFTNFEKFEIRSGSGNDTITTGDGNDNIYTGTGVDTVDAGAGNDFIYSNATSGTIDGGSGIDFFQGGPASAANLTVNIGSSINFSSGLTVTNVEGFGIGGGSGDDLFNVNRDGGSVYGGGGSDTLAYNVSPASAVQVSITAYSGNQLDGTVGGNFGFSQFESVSLAGSQLNDAFQIRIDPSAATYSASGLTLDGAGGTDSLTIDFAFAKTAVSLVVAANGTISSSLGQFSNFETFTLEGGAGADTFTSGTGNDTLAGGSGADHLDGGAGNDFLYSDQYLSDDDGAADVLIGGAGNDTIAAGYGDSVDGGSGFDTLYYTAAAASAGITANFAQLTSGGTITVGGATLTGVENIAQATATNFNDTIIVGSGLAGPIYLLAGDDTLSGGSAAVSIFGGDGNDQISGSTGNDNLSGDEGNDTITGGLGQDSLAGGNGNDIFKDSAAGLKGDTIADFDIGDKIIITDASLSGFSVSYSNGTLSFTGGSVAVRPLFPGTFVASAAPGGGVELDFQPAPVATIDQIANELTTGYWDGDVHRWAVTQGGTLTVNISTLNPAEQNLARVALQEWTDIIGVNFQEVTTGAQITFDHSEGARGSIAATDSVWANGIITSAHIQISTSWTDLYGTRLDSYAFQTYVHEIGHALGLGHAGDYNFTGTYANDALFLNDSWATSVMSYFDQGENFYFADQRFTIFNAVTPMQADIVAMQSLYGFSTSTRTGNTVYGDGSNAGAIYDDRQYGDVAITIFDSGGIDTLVYASSGRGELINLNPETFSNVNGYVGNLSIGRGTIIENAVGSDWADTIVGNTVDNVLTGNGGGDTLTGGAGNDTFKDTAAGHGGDTITDFSRGDRIVISDATLAGFTFSLSGNQLNFTGGSMTLSNLNFASMAASAAPGGGVQITFAGPPIILSAGSSVPLSAAASIQSAQAAETPPKQILDQSDFRSDHPVGWHAGMTHWEAPHAPQADLFALA